MSVALEVLASAFLPSPADMARVVSLLYTLSLVVTLPFLGAALGAFLLRHAAAGTRALVWRSTAFAVPLVCLGHLLELPHLTAVVPAALAGPLVALGRLQLSDPSGLVSAPQSVQGMDVGPVAASAWLVPLLFALYVTGLLVAALAMLRGWRSARLLARRGRRVREGAWDAALGDAVAALGVRRRVALLVADVAVPLTCGILRPAVVLPRAALRWKASARRGVLLHEVAHVCGADLAFAAAARLACVALWFHPGAWWVAARLRDECELAADDRVLAAGVRASDYAELLVFAADAADAADAASRGARPLALAFALSNRGGLRRRLSSILDTGRDLRGPARRTVAWAVAITIAVATPASAVRLAPTRDVLTTLMRDARWESRAYAVIGLAQRADSVDVARAVAASDPSPRVRAWARLALSRPPGGTSARLPARTGTGLPAAFPVDLSQPRS